MGSDSRLNTVEIKAVIYKKIGHQRADSYFDQLGKFLTWTRITKSEFDKLCIKTIGRENITLHNLLVRSILKNASVAKSPPPRNLKKSAFPLSPRKCRSRRFRDRPSPLGPLGKPQSITTTNEESMSKVRRLPVEDGEEVEQITVNPSAMPTAPLGVSIKGTRKAIFRNGEVCQNSGELPDTKLLRSRLEREGIKLCMDSANLLNSGLDAFMRRLIEPCLSLASQQKRVVSMLDFRAALELNPRVLGEEWPTHLEKICSHASQE